MAEHMLSTIDNPFNPFHSFNEWYAYDTMCGYGSLSLLARIVRTSDELTEGDQSQAIEDAIEEVVRENVSGLHVKVTEDSVAPLSNLASA